MMGKLGNAQDVLTTSKLWMNSFCAVSQMPMQMQFLLIIACLTLCVGMMSDAGLQSQKSPPSRQKRGHLSPNAQEK